MRPRSSTASSPGKEVRLRYAYFVTCREAVKNAAGEVVELRCTYDPATRGGNTPPDGRKVQATLHWVSAADAVPAEVRLYNPLFTQARPGRRQLRGRPQSEFARGAGRARARAGAGRRQCAASPCSSSARAISVRDPDSKPGRLVFNRTVGLRDTWAKVSAAARADLFAPSLGVAERGHMKKMTMADDVTTAFLDAFAQAWNRHDTNAIVEMMTPDCVLCFSAGATSDDVPLRRPGGSLCGDRGSVCADA